MKEKIQNGKLEKLTRIAFLIVFLILGYETYLIFRERNIASVESETISDFVTIIDYYNRASNYTFGVSLNRLKFI